ncbi:hypothetical protein [Nonomuraea sp. NPDC049309]|uniref:hypothetical protein n=1 Tax=Nonomuraea sp. NPDC049309 TaxID=3364350 RepID=UPI0037224783
MKRTLSVLIAAGVLGTALAAGGPAAAATSSIDCESLHSDWDYALELSQSNNFEKKAITNYLWQANGYETTYEICLDVPDGETLHLVLRDLRKETREQVLLTDDRPGDKIVRFTMPPNSWFRYDGTLTGPEGQKGHYRWYEKLTPHIP